MNESLYLNKISFLNEEERRGSFLLISIIFVIILFWSICLVKISLTIKTVALYNEETTHLEIYWPYEQINQLTQIEKIKIGDLIEPFKIVNISEIKVDSQLNNYQIIEIKSPKKYLKNQVIDIELLDKKEKIVLKIKKILLGG